MKPLFDGLVVFSSEDDAGKTTACMECGPLPEEMSFINADIKGEDVKSQVEKLGHKFAFYCDLVHGTAGMMETAYHDYCLKLIEDLPQTQAIVWDTWTQFESTFHPYVTRYQNKFRETWSPKGDIHGAQIWQSSFEYETVILDRLLHKCNMLLITTHLKDQNINGKKTGLKIPDMKKPLWQKAQMRIFLRHNPDSPAPIGLVLKRISRITVNDETGMETISILPRKINPCTWKKIRWYWENPVGDRPLTEDEKPDAYELSILDGTLTEDQKMVLKLEPVFESDEDEVVPVVPAVTEEQTAEIKRLKEEGKSYKEIMDKTGVRLPAIMKVLKA